jgi:hypothetical protein
MYIVSRFFLREKRSLNNGGPCVHYGRNYCDFYDSRSDLDDVNMVLSFHRVLDDCYVR